MNELKMNGYRALSDSKVSPDAERMAKAIFKNDGNFRRSKPKNATGDAKYVWRMVAFYSGLRPQMPVTADFDLDEYWWDRSRTDNIGAERREHTKYLDCLVDEILAAFPKEAERGTLRWGKALGRF